MVEPYPEGINTVAPATYTPPPRDAPLGSPFFDSVWSKLQGKPYITVSAKGIANGLSDIPNDGADFGPDTPGTQTSGIQEAIDYIASKGGGKVHLRQGVYNINFNDAYKIDPVSGNAYVLGIGNIPGGIILEGESTGFWGGVYGSGYLLPQTDINYSTVINFNVTGALPTTYNDGLFVQEKASVGYFTNVDVGIFNILFSTNISDASPNYFICVNMNYASSVYGDFTVIGPVASSYTNTQGFQTPNIGSQGGQVFSRLYIAGFHTGLTLAGGHVSINQLYIDTCINAILINNYTHSSEILYANIQNVAYIFYNPPGTSQIDIENCDTEISPSRTPAFVSLATGTSTINGHIKFWQPTSLAFPSLGTIPPGLKVDWLGEKTPSTPSVPASGTAQQNTNPYPVKVYINGGAITEIQITIGGTSYTVYSNSTASAVYENFTLPAGASITLTYTTAPTWTWVPE